MKIANHLRTHGEEYAPFLGYENNSDDYLKYCDDVESVDKAIWGGQIEIRAFSNAYEKQVWIYDSQAPILKFGEEYMTDPVIRLTYHRHYYALGEHYNSIELKKN